MAATLPVTDAVAHQQTLQISFATERRRPAKADLKRVRSEQWRPLAAACAHAILLARWTRKEAAAHLDMSESQLAAQCAAIERPQVERFYASDVLRGPLLIAMAALSGEFDVTTTISVRERRTA